MPSPTSVRIRSATSCSAERVARPLGGALDARLHVDGLEELELLLGRQVAPRTEAVGECAGFRGRAEQLGEATGPAALAEHRQHAPQLLAELGRLLGRGFVDDLVGLDPQRRAGPGHAGAEARPVLAAQDRGRDAVRQLARLLHRRHRADPREAPVDPWDEQQPTVGPVGRGDGRAGLVGVEREGGDGVGQHHAGVEGQHRQGEGVQLGHQGSPIAITGLRDVENGSPGPTYSRPRLSGDSSRQLVGGAGP